MNDANIEKDTSSTNNIRMLFSDDKTEDRSSESLRANVTYWSHLYLLVAMFGAGLALFILFVVAVKIAHGVVGAFY